MKAPAILLPFFLLASSYACPLNAADGILTNLRHGHPRLILTSLRITDIKAVVNTDPTAKHYYEQALKDAEAILKNSPVTYTQANKQFLNQSRSVLKVVSTTAALYQLNGDLRLAERAKKELLTAATFLDWNPTSFLSTAEMTFAFALGYDWLFDTFTPEEERIIREAILIKGLKPGHEAYKNSEGWQWHKVRHNWNTVCNSGLIAGALAVADREPAAAKAILEAAKQSLPTGFLDYAPDGGWPEGPMYWSYGTSYAVYGLACLDSALGTDWDLTASPGFSRTGEFRMNMIGPSGLTFNFADSQARPASSPCMFWLSRRFNRPDFDAAERLLALENPSIFHLIFFNGNFSAPSHAQLLGTRPLTSVYKGVHVATLKAGHDKTANWIALKGGSNTVNHAHLDLGSFVIDSGGQRFAEELGPDDYSLPGYFGSNRKITTESVQKVRIHCSSVKKTNLPKELRKLSVPLAIL